MVCFLECFNFFLCGLITNLSDALKSFILHSLILFPEVFDILSILTNFFLECFCSLRGTLELLFQLLILFQEGLCNSSQQCQMCDSVSHVLGHVFARQSHLTTSIVEWAVDFCEGTFYFHVVLYILPFKKEPLDICWDM